MRYLLPTILLAAAGLLALPAWAQPPEDGGKKSDRPNREEMRQRLRKEFDKDGDGKLSDEERQTMREAMRERFGRDRDGQRRGTREGRGPEGRRGPGGQPRIERLFDRFDKDKNDSLSRQEFAELAQFIREHRPPGPPRGPGGPRPEGSPRDGGRRRPPRPDGPPGQPPEHDHADDSADESN